MAYNPENINNFSDNASEAVEKGKNKNYLRNKIIALGLAASIAVSFGGCGEEKLGAPTEAGPAYEYEEFQPDSPICISVAELGVDKFIERYSDYYSDPETAYARLLSYEENHDGESIFINPDYITFYNTAIGSGQEIENTYNLGFDTVDMPLDASINNEAAVEMFNNYTKKQIDRCLNLISCNPGATDLIQNEFLSQYPKNDPLDPYNASENEGAELFNHLISTVTEYGDYCTYTTINASEDLQDESDTIFYNTTSRQDNRGYDSDVKLRIDVQDYSKLDEDNVPIAQIESIDLQLKYKRLATSVDSNGIITYSEKTVFGITHAAIQE